MKKVEVLKKKPVPGSGQIQAEIAALEQALAAKRKLAEAVATIEAHGDYEVVRKTRAKPPARPPLQSKAIKLRSKRPARKIEARNYGRPTWTDEIWRVLSSQTAGMSFGDLLAEVAKGELGKHRSKGDKGFYGALHRMFASGDVLKVRGLLYTAALVETLRAKGEQLPEASRPGNGRGGSRDIIRDVLIRHPQGLTGRQIKELASKHAEAPTSLRGKSHYIYNVLGQMKKAGEILHEGDIYRVSSPSVATNVMH